MGTLIIKFSDGKISTMKMDYLSFVTFAKDRIEELVKQKVICAWNYRLGRWLWLRKLLLL